VPLPPKSMAEIRKSVLAVHNLVQSLETRYCVSAPSGDPEDPTFYQRHHLAVKGRLRFRENVHFTVREPPSFDVNHAKDYFTVKSLDIFYVNRRYYETSRNNASLHYAWKTRLDPVLECLGWWPEEDDRPPAPDAKAPPAFLRFVFAIPDYVLRQQPEAVEGHLCHVVEMPGLDRIWLDPQIGYAIRKREAWHPVSKALLRRQTSSEFREYPVSGPAGEQAVWFPARIRLDAAGKADAPSEETGLDIVIEDLKINRVDDGVFKFVPPPGTLIADRDTGKLRQVPGGLDLLDHSAVIAQQMMELSRTQSRQGPRGIPPEAYGLLAVSVALIALNVRLYLRRR